MKQNKVAVTGMGIVSPIGNSIDKFLINLENGLNGIKKISLFDTSDFNIKIAGESDIDLSKYFSSKEINRMDRFTAFSLIASRQAINQSHITKDIDHNKIGVIIGSGIGGINTFETQHKKLLKHPKSVSPFFIPSMIANIAAGQISIKYGYKGINYAVMSACATGNHAIGDAFRQIKHGYANIMIAGGSEASISPISISGFSNMKALTKNPDVNTACRPFDLNRDGFVMGEGAGTLVLENLNHAKKRGAPILAELTGYGATADAYHLTSPVPNGIGALRSMKLAIEESNIHASDIDYINAHGTSTPFNDKNETIAIKSLLGKKAHHVSISSTKSMMGHLLGATGAVESIASILSINNSFIPPTINYKTKDSDCNLNYTPNESIKKNISYAMSNTFGFGGHNATLIFKKYE